MNFLIFFLQIQDTVLGVCQYVNLVLPAFRSRTKNMMWYGVLGTKELLQRTYKNLEQKVQLEVNFIYGESCWHNV